MINRKTENKKIEAKKEEKPTTNCFTYEVKMIIQVLAENEASAKEKLDSQGGYVTSRTVKLMDSISLFNGEENNK